MKKISAEKLLLEVRLAIIAPAGSWKISFDNDEVVAVESNCDKMSLFISCERIGDTNQWEVGASLWSDIEDDFLFQVTGSTLSILLRKVCKKLQHLRNGLNNYRPYPIIFKK